MNKVSVLLIVIILAFSGVNSFGQSTSDEASVKEVISTLFKAMEVGDSSMLHSAFYDHVTLATVFRDKNGNPQMRTEETITDFLKAVGTPHKEVWHEEIWDVKVAIDGDFAQVWCDYAFYVDKNFSHCGINTFHFFKSKNGWKIFHLADTRRKTGCNIPKEIEAKYK